MKKFQIQRILIPVDFSETALLALEHAVFMAKLNKAEITLLHVIESITFTSAITDSFVVGTEFEASIEKAASEKLKTLAEDIRKKSGVTVKTVSKAGRIYMEVVNVAKEIDADLIIMGTHGVSGFREFLVGSNAYRVVSESPCPVISVQTHTKKIGFKNIVLPIDDTFHSRQKVRYAQEIADKYGAVIHILGLVTEEGKDFEKKFNLKVKQVEDYFTKHNVSHKTKIVHGNKIAKLCMEYANEVDADLIITMTEQEFDVSGIILGQAAQQIVNHSKIPVMSISPQENLANVDLHGYGF